MTFELDTKARKLIYKIALWGTIGGGLLTVGFFWIAGLFLWAWMYAIIFATVVGFEIASYVTRGHSMSEEFVQYSEEHKIMAWPVAVMPLIAMAWLTIHLVIKHLV